jgi:hypothetical protein
MENEWHCTNTLATVPGHNTGHCGHWHGPAWLVVFGPRRRHGGDTAMMVPCQTVPVSCRLFGQLYPPLVASHVLVSSTTVQKQHDAASGNLSIHDQA